MQTRSDYVFLSYIIILLLFGLAMLTSASSAVGLERFNDSYFFIKRQLLYGVLPGIVAFFVCAKLPYKIWEKNSYFIYILTLVSLILVFIPGLGTTLNTAAHSWILIGGQSFQPAEVAKLGMVVFLASYLAKKGTDMMDLKKGFLPALFVGGIPIVLVILQPDIGTVAILFAILFGMLFIAETKLSHIGVLSLAGVALFAIMIIVAPYRTARLTTFLHPELDPQGIGYQINQAFIAIGSGGFFGLGLGHSRQKFQYLPEVHADSIFAVMGEEMGFLITSAFVLLLTLIALRGFVIAKNAPDRFARLLVSGIIIWIIFQSFLNIGAMVGILPLTGVPLPFVSHGGTALMMALAGAGMVVNVSKSVKV